MISRIVYEIGCIAIRILNILFFRRFHLYNQTKIPKKGPLLIIANHPNGFLDPLLVAAYIKQPIYFLARGDVFTNPFVARFLRFMHVMPIYRFREGKQNLNKNFDTFDQCHNLLKSGATILIFGEGLCENNWDLRPMMKGAARMVWRAWMSEDVKHLKVATAGITYEHFAGANKSVILSYGDKVFSKEMFDISDENKFARSFNAKLYNAQLRHVLFAPDMTQNDHTHQQFSYSLKYAEQKGADISKLIKEWPHTLSSQTQPLLKLNILEKCVKGITKDSVFFDSVLYVCYLLPILLALFFVILYPIFRLAKFLLLLI
jgi:1-acyl-sn-glycerol-3-phosphate acyltransferase